jgi:carbon starvation protein
LLAGLALVVISYWLRQQGKNFFVSLIPALIIMVFTSWALVHTLGSLYDSGNIPSLVIGCIALVLQIWLSIEGLTMLAKEPAGSHAEPAIGG